MFSINQRFSVSCREDQLEAVISLALNMQLAHHKNPTLVYQFTEDGKFAIGWCGNEPKSGWVKFPFDRPSNEMLIAMIKQYISTQSALHKYCMEDADFGGDGSTSPGYLVEVIKETFADKWDGIRSPSHGIIYIRAYNCYYSK